MKIGLYDVNKSAYKKMRYEFPEIDLMKVYAYHKKRGDAVELVDNFEVYKDYDQFYCFNNRRHVVSKGLLNLGYEENVHLVGLCFNGDIWIPMDDDIERCEPDITAYSSFLRNNIINDSLPPWVASLFSNYYYLRYYYYGWHWNVIPNKIKDKKIILYDTDLTAHKGWQEMVLKLKKDSGKNFVCRHEVPVRSLEDLRFIADNKLYRTATKYPTKYIIDIPELHNDFENVFLDNLELFKEFPANCLFVYQNHSLPNESKTNTFIRLVNECMYALNHNVEIYPIYDYSVPPHQFDLYIKRVTYYFTMRKPGTVYDILHEKKDPSALINSVREENPIFYDKIQSISRADVKKKIKVWKYGE